jgi:hypothetical protein
MSASSFDERTQLELVGPPMPMVAKRLSSVEVNPNASHQREFHAGVLRKVLEFRGTDDVSGTLQIAIYEADGRDPLVETCRYSLYDARRANPHRSAEWRLYPETDLFQRRAHEGDLMVVVRLDKGTDLSILVARPGTKVEELLAIALRVGDGVALHRFAAVEPQRLTERESAQLALELTPHSPATALPSSESRLRKQYVEEAAARLMIPSSAALASTTHEIMIFEYGASLPPDDFLSTAVEVESSLFFAIEERVGAARIAAISARSGGFADVMKVTQSMLQSRKNRMGQSLQNHFAAVLRGAGIPFTPQCPTERGQKPDFVIPGKDAYHDPMFPADLLRMVGCKSRVRERWRQYELEAERIPIKHHVSLDEGMSSELLYQMNRANLRLHMPARLIATHYETERHAGLVNTIEALVTELSGVTYTARARGFPI